MSDIRFTVRLADTTIRAQVLHESTRAFCADYCVEAGLPEASPAFSVAVSPDDIAAERERSARQNEIEGIPVRHYGDEYLETLALYRKIADGLLAYDTVLFHGSAVAVDGIAYLFAARSGTGKSTHARLWREVLGARTMMVNDDKPLLRVTDCGTFVYGTPWDGKHHLSTNTSAPLRAVCLISQGSENAIRAIDGLDALPRLLGQIHRPAGEDSLVAVLDLLDRMARTVAFYEMECLPDVAAARMSFSAMSGEVL